MKLFFIFFSVFIILLLAYARSFAQNMAKKNDSLFTEVKKLLNEQNGDAVYSMLNERQQAKMSMEVFTDVLKNNLYPLLPIKKAVFLKYSKGVSSYKATCNNDVLQEFRIGADSLSDKIATIRFLPYKDETPLKNYIVPADNKMQTELDIQVDTIARSFINKVTTVGLSIGVLKQGAAYTYGYGSTDKDKNQIPGPDAIFEIASATKTFTATLLAYYVVVHKVALTDPITKYLPDSVASNKELQQITLQMLANHSSGLPRIPGNLLSITTDIHNPYKNYDEKKLFAYLKNCKPGSVPGEKYAYSNLGAGLLGVILERVSGKTFEQMVTDVICVPLGMTNTMQHPNATQKERQVTAYNDKTEPVNMWDSDALAGAGAIRSTVHDMLLYAAANMKKDKTGLSEAMELTHRIALDKGMVVGLGWHTDNSTGKMYYWHNGATGGCHSYIAFDPEKNCAVVVLSNSAEDSDDVGVNIMRMLQKE